MAIDDLNVGPRKFEPFSPPEEPPPKQGRGCFFWGCLISAILALLVVIAIVVGVVMLRNFAINFLNQYTEPQSAEIPEVNLAADEQADVVKRWEEFKAALDAGKPAELSLDSQEFNVVVQHIEPSAKGAVYFDLNGEELSGKVSIPMDKVGQFLKSDKLNGRFFNGEGNFDLFVRNGTIVVTMKGGSTKGQVLPPEAIDQMKGQNLAESMNQNPDVRQWLSKVSSVEIKDGRFVIRSGEGGAVDDEATPAVEDAAATEPTDETDAAPPDSAEEKPDEAAAPEVPKTEDTPAEEPKVESPQFARAA